VIHRLAQKVNHGRAVRRGAEALADPHAAQADRRDGKGLSQGASGHASSFLRSGSRHPTVAMSRLKRRRRRGSTLRLARPLSACTPFWVVCESRSGRLGCRRERRLTRRIHVAQEIGPPDELDPHPRRPPGAGARSRGRV
jgi:hypothetical protein